MTDWPIVPQPEPEEGELVMTQGIYMEPGEALILLGMAVPASAAEGIAELLRRKTPPEHCRVVICQVINEPHEQ